MKVVIKNAAGRLACQCVFIPSPRREGSPFFVSVVKLQNVWGDDQIKNEENINIKTQKKYCFSKHIFDNLLQTMMTIQKCPRQGTEHVLWND